jgi:hypothetical protein
MKLADEGTIGVWVPLPVSLDSLISRLEALSLRPQFAVQRDLALSRALQGYLSATVPLKPLEQEIHLAELFLYADFYPEDGQLTLIEQLRDVITEHIPEEERGWLDPLKHSYMDLVEVLRSTDSAGALMLRSLGDGRAYRVALDPPGLEIQAGKVLLARLTRRPDDPASDDATIAGSAVVLSAEDAKSVYESVGDYRRELEMTGGSFELGDWPEFAKRFGHMLLLNFARMRVAALVDAVVNIRYVDNQDQAYLYGIALYEHHEFSYLRDSLSELKGFRPQYDAGPSAGGDAANHPRRTWVMAASTTPGDAAIAARLTLTPTQLMVECDSRDRLDAVKHALAAAYGFSLHFRGETVTPPAKEVTAAQLATDQPLIIRITPEEDRALLGKFLETAYLEWADQESPAMGGQTPRHAVASDAGREKVDAVIAAMERDDLGLRRTGARAFDYNKLRAHVGLEEGTGG